MPMHEPTTVCPKCGFKGELPEFDMSLSDECFCPNCGEEFMVIYEEDEDNA